MTQTTIINGALITEIVNGVKSLISLFGEFPFNVFLIGSIAGIMWRQARQAKKTAR